MTEDNMIRMAAGNIGALSVLATCIKTNRHDIIEHLDKGGFRGPGIWLAWKDCGDETLPTRDENTQDIERLTSKLRALGYLPTGERV